MIRICRIAFIAWIALAAVPALALNTVTENFNDDPFWTSLNATAVNDNYGYSPSTNNAGGGVGEAGGLFGRHDAFDSFYADTDLGGTLSALNPLHSSGKVSIDSSLSPQFPMNISFFDQTKPDKGGNALRINIINGGQFMLWLRLKIGKNLQSPVTSGLVTGDYTWAMNWDPTGNGGLGTGTVTFSGVSPGTPASLSATLNIPMRNEPGKPEWLQEPIFFDAFGMQNYDGEATTSGQYRVFIDDVTYTVVNPPATTSAWGLPGSGEWTNSLNWDPGEVPFGDDRTAVFGNAIVRDTTVLVDREITVKSIEFNNASFDYAVAGSGKIKLDAQSGTASIAVLQGTHELQARTQLQVTTNVSTNPGGMLEFDGVVVLGGHTLQITTGSNVRFQNLSDDPTSGIVNNLGVLSGAGRVNGNLNNQSGATVAPGNSTGVLRVDGVYSQNATASLAIELGGTAVGEFDVLSVSGSATLDGVLSVSLVDGFSLSGDEVFTVLTAAGGIVDNGIALGGPDGELFFFNLVGNSLVLSAGLQGDYNRNGTVDAADYTVWRDTLGSTIDLRADGNANQMIDVGDYTAWKTNYGNTSGGSGGAANQSATVPEPRGLMLVTLALVATAVGHTRRRQATTESAWLRWSVVRLMMAATAATVSVRVADAELIGNSFNVNPLWQGNDNILPQGDPNKARDDFNNYGYNSVTRNAFGSTGEIGGYFGMNTFDSYYADTTLGGSLGGSFPLQQTLHASGRLMVNSGHSPTWNMNIGFFDATDYSASMSGAQESGSGDAVRFAIIEQTPDFRLRLEIRQQGNGYNGPLLVGPAGLLDGMYTWTMDYNPTGGVGGSGRLSLSMLGPTIISTFVDVDAGGKNIPMNLNAFGFTNYNSGVSRPDLNKHYTFLDDLTYTTNETVDTELQWASPRHGSWSDAYNWSSTSRSDGAGFVPNGNDRKAIFAAGINGDSIVSVDGDVTVRDLEFNSSTHSYAVVGAGLLILDHQSGGQARIDVTAGDHQFQSELRLATDTLIEAQAGTQLDFNNTVDLDGHTLTLSGDGQVNINNVVVAGAGGTIDNQGLMGGSGSITGDLSSTGTLLLAINESSAAPAFHVQGAADLAGVLDLTHPSDMSLSPGDTFTVLTAGAIRNQGLALAPEDAAHFRLRVNSNSLVVEVAVPEPPSCVFLVLGLVNLASFRLGPPRTIRRPVQKECESQTVGGNGRNDGAELP